MATKISKMNYLVQTYLPIVLNGEDFSKFKNPTEIYYYIRDYVDQITAGDMDLDGIDSYDLAENIAYKIYSMQKAKKKTRKAPVKRK